MNIVAVETIKYKGKNRVPGTESATFDCAKDIAKGLIRDKKAIIPQTLEQANKPTGQQQADELIDEAKKKAAELINEAKEGARKEAKEIIEAAEEKAAELIKGAEDKVAEIVDEAQANLDKDKK